MAGRKILLAGMAGVGAVAGIVAMSGPGSAAVTPKPDNAAHASAVRAGARAGTATGAPASATVPVTGQAQQTNYWCVPASSSMSLKSMGVTVSQASLAQQMKTTSPSGTTGDNALPVLNKYASPQGYAYSWADVSTGAKMLNDVSYDVGVLRRDAPLFVWGQKLPWNQGKESGNVGHMILTYGYNTANNTITVWDPAPSRGGSHTINANTLAADSQHQQVSPGVYVYALGYITKK